MRDDEKPKDAVTKAVNATHEVVEVVGHIPAAIRDLGCMTEGHSSWRTDEQLVGLQARWIEYWLTELGQPEPSDDEEVKAA